MQKLSYQRTQNERQLEQYSLFEKKKKQIRSIRRLTTVEVFRLQGFLFDQINLDGISDSQRYKLAGNGWSINVFQKIFEEMFIYKRKEKSLLDF